MISVDEAITRSGLEWTPDRAHVENETAYQDRTILAAEVISVREALAEAEREIKHLRDEDNYNNWP